MFKKFSFSTWLGIAIVAVLVAVNVPRVFSDVFLCTDGTNRDHIGPCYGNEITMGFYGYYGYGSDTGYWTTYGSQNPWGELYGNIPPSGDGTFDATGQTITGAGLGGETYIFDDTTVFQTGIPGGTVTIDGTTYTNSVTVGGGTLQSSSGDVIFDFGDGTIIGSNSPLSPWSIDDTFDVSTVTFTNSTGLTTTGTAFSLNLGQCVTFSTPLKITLNTLYPRILYVAQHGPNAGQSFSDYDCLAGDPPSIPSYMKGFCTRRTATETIIYVSQACSVYSPAGGSSTTSTGGGGGGGGIAPVTTGAVPVVTVTTTETVVTTPSGKTFTVPAGARVRAQLFPDVPRGAWYHGYVEVLRKGGIVHGTQAGDFEPARDLTRAELVKIALNTFAIDIPTSVSARPFNDVGTQHWAAPYIQRAKSLGIVSGYADGTFRADQSVNRVEALKILLLASGLGIEGGDMNFPDTVKGSWYDRYVAFAQSLGIVGGYPDGTFQPGNNIKRSEMAKIAVETLEEVL